MGIVAVPDVTDPSIIASRGFGGAGISKVGAGIQAGKLAYRTAKWAYKRYFGYATKTRSRTIGTATGSGIGIGGGIVALLSSPAKYRPIGKTRGLMDKSRAKRLHTAKHHTGKGRCPICC